MELRELFKVGKVEAYPLMNMRGLVLDFVFRRLKSGTYISRRPKKPATRTEGQLLGQKRFKAASEFAKQQLQHPDRRAHYQQIFEQNPKRYRSARLAAISDYMNRPETVIQDVPKSKSLRPDADKKAQKCSWRTHEGRAPIKRSSITLARMKGWKSARVSSILDINFSNNKRVVKSIRDVVFRLPKKENGLHCFDST